MERTLDLSIKLYNDEEFSITISEPESGVTKTDKYVFVGSDPHPEFDDLIGNEIYSWVSLWMDQLRDQNKEECKESNFTFSNEVVEVCPYCDHENCYINRSKGSHGGFMEVCDNCGRIIMLCSECMAEEYDTCNQRCEGKYCICKKGIHPNYETNNWHKVGTTNE